MGVADADTAYDGVDYVKPQESASDSERYELSTTVNGAGILTFRYKSLCSLSNQAVITRSNEYFSFKVDNNEIFKTKETSDWQLFTHNIATDGPHTVTFFYLYVKTSNETASGVYLDQLFFGTPAQRVEATKNALTWVVIAGENSAGETQVTKNLELPAADDLTVTQITWASSDTRVISNEGVVTQPSATVGSKTVTLTATIIYESAATASTTKEFTLTVLPMEPETQEPPKTPSPPPATLPAPAPPPIRHPPSPPATTAPNTASPSPVPATPLPPLRQPSPSPPPPPPAVVKEGLRVILGAETLQ